MAKADAGLDRFQLVSWARPGTPDQGKRAKNDPIRVCAQIDRLQLVSCPPSAGQRPPPLKGFAITRDSFVRCQTTTATYARCRQYESVKDDTKIYWQYQRQKGWLRPWKITIVADDKTGLSYEEIERVLRHCHAYRVLTVEIAIDFSPSAGITGQFIRQHGVFGKSHQRATTRAGSSSLLRRQKE